MTLPEKNPKFKIVGLSISAVASFAEVPPVSLRYWEKLGLIKSMRTPGGHRLYAPELLPLIRKIKSLLRDGKTKASDLTFGIPESRVALARKIQNDHSGLKDISK